MDRIENILCTPKENSTLGKHFEFVAVKEEVDNSEDPATKCKLAESMLWSKVEGTYCTLSDDTKIVIKEEEEEEGDVLTSILFSKDDLKLMKADKNTSYSNIQLEKEDDPVVETLQAAVSCNKRLGQLVTLLVCRKHELCDACWGSLQDIGDACIDSPKKQSHNDKHKA